MFTIVSGGTQLQRVAVKLRAAGTEGQGLRRRMRKNLVASVKPMQDAVKRNALGIPVKGHGSTGLRKQIARATKIRIRASGRTAVVRLWVNPDLMPAGKWNLPAYMEGEGDWRHPVFGDSENWVPQTPHPYFKPAVEPRLIGVRQACIAAVKETAATITI